MKLLVTVAAVLFSVPLHAHFCHEDLLGLFKDRFQPLARGAEGYVYRGTLPNSDQPIAIKSPVKFGEPPIETKSKRLRREARNYQIIAKAGHPGTKHFVQTTYVKSSEGPVLVMDLVQGTPLHELAGNLHISTILNIGKQLSDALAAAHAADMVHADIKPANLLLDDEGVVRVVDLGLSSPDLTLLKSPKGTPGYIPVYQSKAGQLIQRRRDVYASLATLGQLMVPTSEVSRVHLKRDFDGLRRDTGRAFFDRLRYAPYAVMPEMPPKHAQTFAMLSSAVHARDAFATHEELRHVLTTIEAAMESGDIDGWYRTVYFPLIQKATRQKRIDPLQRAEILYLDPEALSRVMDGRSPLAKPTPEKAAAVRSLLNSGEIFPSREYLADRLASTQRKMESGDLKAWYARRYFPSIKAAHEDGAITDQQFRNITLSDPEACARVKAGESGYSPEQLAILQLQDE